MTKVVPGDERCEEILTETQVSFASDLIRRIASKGLFAPYSLESEEIRQICMAVLVGINNRGTIDL